jgi:hypothetical protein
LDRSDNVQALVPFACISGTLGSNQTGAKSRGLTLHSTFAVAPNGLPLGVVKAQCLAPVSKSKKDKRPIYAIPIEEKETFVWLEHHRDLVALSAKLSQTRLVHVCDREADFFELFHEQRRNPGVDLLVRAQYNRCTVEEPFKLFETARQVPVASRIQINIPRQSARPKKVNKRPNLPDLEGWLIWQYVIFVSSSNLRATIAIRTPSNSGWFMP